MTRVRLPAAAVAAIVCVTRLLTLPRTFWQGEEIRFARALLTFDPLQQQPEPPGYPLYVAIARLFDFFIRNPYVALLALSVVAVTAGAYLVAVVAAELLGSVWAGSAVALVLYFSPAMLAFDALPNSEAVTMAIIAATLLAMLRRNALWFGIFAAAATGVRPQVAIAMIALYICAAPRVLARRWWLITVPAAVIAICFIPLIEAIGTSNVIAYAKTNYAALRTASEAAGLHGRELLLRFIAHPWGAKWTSFPLLIAAGVGFATIARRAWILAVFAIAHLAFCFAFADRAAGVQPVIPSLIVVAIFAIAAFSRWPLVALVLAAAYAIGGFAYAWPLLHERRMSLSPPARAMRHARRVVPANGVLLYEPSLEAWARTSRFEVAPVRDFDRFADRDAALYLLADGGSHTPHAAIFEWPDSDAYGKVTTERYRVVSLIPFPRSARYRTLGGVHAFERTPDGREWRWLEGDAVIELPQFAATEVRLTLALPDDAPVDSNDVAVNGTHVRVARGQTVTFALRAAPLLRIHCARTFTSPRDRRALAVQLVALEQR